MGQTLNTMTLGGLALAVGILVDDATVEIENIHRNLGDGEAGHPRHPRRRAADRHAGLRLDAVHLHRLRAGRLPHRRRPSTCSRRWRWRSCFAMLRHLLPVAHAGPDDGAVPAAGRGPSAPATASEVKDGGLDLVDAPPLQPPLRALPGRLPRVRSSWALGHRWLVVVGFVALVVVSLGIFPLLGLDFFPTVDAGQFRLHVRAPAGTRIEETEASFAAGRGRRSARSIPADEVQMIIDNIGMPSGGINLAFTDASITSAAPTARSWSRSTRRSTRRRPGTSPACATILRERFPDLVFFFQPADIVSQILNFGLPAPIDVQIVGRNPKNLADRPGPGAAHQRRPRRRRRPPAPGRGRTDHQRRRRPAAREGARAHGAANVATSLLVSLSGIAQIAPNYWLNPQNGVNYAVGGADAPVSRRLR